MKLNKPHTTEEFAEFVIKANEQELVIEDKGEYFEAKALMPLSLAEQAKDLSMTKAEFLILVTGLTKNMPTPITLEAIEAMLAANSDIRMRFSYANTVERSHPMLDGVSANFGVAPELLDIMFINKAELIYKIDNNLPLE